MASPSSASLTACWEIKTGAQRRRAEWAREQRQEERGVMEGGKDAKGVCMCVAVVWVSSWHWAQGLLSQSGDSNKEVRRGPTLRRVIIFLNTTHDPTLTAALRARGVIWVISLQTFKSFLSGTHPPYEPNANACQGHNNHRVTSKN